MISPASTAIFPVGWPTVGTWLANHLWQSTLFAVAAGLLTLALKKNRAQVRYWLWLVASLKFLIPFSLLVGLGSYLSPSKALTQNQPGLSIVMQEVGQPFVTAKPPYFLPATKPARLWPILLLVLWCSGCVGVLLFWSLRWRRITAAARRALPLESGRELQAQRRLEQVGGVAAQIKIATSASALEPGVIGIFHPVLLLPAGIADRLTDAQLEAIIAHELCHVRRRDNLAAALNMLVEAVFWFHPLVWWIGGRLVDERERACDEDVLRLGNTPQVYAESILRVCQFYLESPLVCVAGVTGSNLKKRIEDIMNNRMTRNLDLARKLLLTTAGVATVIAPLALGFLSPTPGQARGQVPALPQPQLQRQDAVGPAFATVSIQPSNSDHKGWWSHSYPDGRFVARNANLKALIQTAYGITLISVPDTLTLQRYDIDANAGGPAEEARLKRMLRTLLSTRFKLASHITTKEMPVYALVVGSQGPKFRLVDTPEDKCQVTIRAPGGEAHIVGKGTSACLANIFTYLSQENPPSLDRPVLDNTKLKGVFDFDIPVDLGTQSSFFAAVQQLGLKLEPKTAPIELLVVDHAEEVAEKRPDPL